jgi:hypothetical protein
VRDRLPAGYVRLSGPFFVRNYVEVMGLVRNEEAREKRNHPLQRIMGIREVRGAVEVATTDVHVARRIGDALRCSPDEYLVRVNWSR